MGTITTKTAITVKGFGEIPKGMKIDFQTNVLAGKKGMYIHTIWHKGQEEFEKGNAIANEIEGLKNGKENIKIELSDLNEEQTAKYNAFIEMMQDLAMLGIRKRIGDYEEVLEADKTTTFKEVKKSFEIK